jgi:lysophospholipase L1-like esterase
VTIDIGGNDGLLLDHQCNGSTVCKATQAPAVLSALHTNLETIFGELRSSYSGTIVALNNYSLNYTNPVINAEVVGANHELSQAAAEYDVRVADTFDAFASTSLSSGGDPCAAGLLLHRPDGSCDVHPTATGRDIVVDTILKQLP